MSDHPAATSGQEPLNAAAAAPITVEQAAAVLGVSITTVKHRIRAGTLRAEQAQRPQGTVWLVYLDAAATPAAEERPSAASVAATAPTTPTAQAEALASLVQATLTPIIAPLVAELAATRQTSERRADRIAEVERENGQFIAERVQARAEVEALRASQAKEDANPGPVAPEATTAPWCRSRAVCEPWRRGWWPRRRSSP